MLSAKLFVFLTLVTVFVAGERVPCPAGFSGYDGTCTECAEQRYSSSTMLYCSSCKSFEISNSNKSACIIPCNGTCNLNQVCNVTSHTCVCAAGYGGSSCSLFDCGTYDTSIIDCVGPNQTLCKNPLKMANTSCTSCQPGRSGPDCNEFDCPGMPSNAVCTAPFSYTCNSGLTGTHCNETAVSSCPSKAIVVDNQCTCVGGYKMVDNVCVKVTADRRPIVGELMNLDKYPQGVIHHNGDPIFINRCTAFNKTSQWLKSNCLTTVYADDKSLMTIVGLNEYKMFKFSPNNLSWTEIHEFNKTVLPAGGYGLYHSSKPDIVYIGGGNISDVSNSTITKVDMTDGSVSTVVSSSIPCDNDCIVSNYGSLFSIIRSFDNFNDENVHLVIDLFDISTEQHQKLNYTFSCFGGSAKLIDKDNILVLCGEEDRGLIKYTCSISNVNCTSITYSLTGVGAREYMRGIIEDATAADITVWASVGSAKLPKNAIGKAGALKLKTKLKVKADYMFKFNNDIYLISSVQPHIAKYDSSKNSILGVSDLTFTKDALDYFSEIENGCSSLTDDVSMVRIYCGFDSWDYRVIDIDFNTKSVALTQLLPEISPPSTALGDPIFFTNGNTMFISGRSKDMDDYNEDYLMKSSVDSLSISHIVVERRLSRYAQTGMFDSENIIQIDYDEEVTYNVENGSVTYKEVNDFKKGFNGGGYFHPIGDYRFLWFGYNLVHGYPVVVYHYFTNEYKTFYMNTEDLPFKEGPVVFSTMKGNVFYGLHYSDYINGGIEATFFEIEMVDVCGHEEGKICYFESGFYEEEIDLIIPTIAAAVVLVFCCCCCRKCCCKKEKKKTKRNALFVEPSLNSTEMNIIHSQNL
ncbi:hypothetical protein PCE1_002008 [Barthelona sp. PCE]